MPEALLAGAGIDPADIPGAAHAAEHAAIGMLPLVATSDRWDIGGVSTALHPDTGLPTILVYDGHPGGAGFAERGFAAARTWLGATRDAIAACECPAGLPVVRAVAQVRQWQRAAGQARRPRAARMPYWPRHRTDGLQRARAGHVVTILKALQPYH